MSNPITLAGTLINNGYFFLSGFNFNTEVTAGFTLATDATLAGTGMNRLGGGEIDATNNATLTLAAGATIAGGSGTINARLINNGTVESVYQALTIDSPTFTNNGLLAANNNASVSVSTTASFTNFKAGHGMLTGGSGHAGGAVRAGASLPWRHGRAIKCRADSAAQRQIRKCCSR